jgi:hypothetical protein
MQHYFSLACNITLPPWPCHVRQVHLRHSKRFVHWRGQTRTSPCAPARPSSLACERRGRHHESSINLHQRLLCMLIGVPPTALRSERSVQLSLRGRRSNMDRCVQSLLLQDWQSQSTADFMKFIEVRKPGTGLRILVPARYTWCTCTSSFGSKAPGRPDVAAHVSAAVTPPPCFCELCIAPQAMHVSQANPYLLGARCRGSLR